MLMSYHLLHVEERNNQVEILLPQPVAESIDIHYLLLNHRGMTDTSIYHLARKEDQGNRTINYVFELIPDAKHEREHIMMKTPDYYIVKHNRNLIFTRA